MSKNINIDIDNEFNKLLVKILQYMEDKQAGYEDSNIRLLQALAIKKIADELERLNNNHIDIAGSEE